MKALARRVTRLKILSTNTPCESDTTTLINLSSIRAIEVSCGEGSSIPEYLVVLAARGKDVILSMFCRELRRATKGATRLKATAVDRKKRGPGELHVRQVRRLARCIRGGLGCLAELGVSSPLGPQSYFRSTVRRHSKHAVGFPAQRTTRSIDCVPTAQEQAPPTFLYVKHTGTEPSVRRPRLGSYRPRSFYIWASNPGKQYGCANNVDPTGPYGRPIE